MRTRSLTFLLASFLLLAGCDAIGGDRGGLLGTWTLASVTTSQNVEVAGPIGSSLTFKRDGFFGLTSVNGCGREYVVRDQRFWVSEAVCTLIGTSPENDLSAFLFQSGDSFDFSFETSGDLRVIVAGPQTYYRLRFERQ